MEWYNDGMVVLYGCVEISRVGKICPAKKLIETYNIIIQV